MMMMIMMMTTMMMMLLFISKSPRGFEKVGSYITLI